MPPCASQWRALILTRDLITSREVAHRKTAMERSLAPSSETEPMHKRAAFDTPFIYARVSWTDVSPDNRVSFSFSFFFFRRCFFCLFLPLSRVAARGTKRCKNRLDAAESTGVCYLSPSFPLPSSSHPLSLSQCLLLPFCAFFRGSLSLALSLHLF